MPTDNAALVQQRLQTLRALSGASIGTLIIIGIVTVLMLSLEDYPSPLVVAGLFLLNVLAFVTAEAFGYRTTPLAPETDEDEALRWGLDALQQTTITRFAITEAPAILALCGAFITGSAWIYVVGAFWAVISMAWHIWPSRRVVAKLERGLDREGGRSHLADRSGRSNRQRTRQ